MTSTNRRRKAQKKTQSEQPIRDLNDYVEQNFHCDVLDLTEVKTDSTELSQLINLIHNAIQSTANAKLTKEEAYQLEQGVSTLITEVSSQANNTTGRSQAQDYASILAQDPSDLNVIKLQIIELKRQNEAIKIERDDARREVVRIQEELENEQAKTKRIISESQRAAGNLEEGQSMLKYEAEKLEDIKRDAEEKVRQANNRVKMAEKNLRNAEDDNAANKREIAALRDRLDQHQKQISKLRTELRRARIQYDELQQSKTESEMNLSKEFLNQSKMADEKARTAFVKLLKHTKAQASQLNKLCEANRKAAEVIEKQNAVMDEFELAIADGSRELEDTRTALESAQTANAQVGDELDETVSILEARTEELTELRRIVSDCLDALGPRYITTQDKLVDSVRMLASTRIDEETAKTLRKLSAAVDGLSRFVVQMVRGQRPDVQLLMGEAKPVFDDSTVRLDILSEIAELRTFLREACFEVAEEDPAMSFLDNFDAEVDLADTADCGVGYVMAAVASLFRRYAAEVMGELGQVKDVLPFVCTDQELPSAVAQYLTELQPVFKQLLDVITRTLHYHGSTADMFQCLCKYVEETAVMMKQLDEDVRPLIGYSGKVVNMPLTISEALLSLKAEADATTNASKMEYTESRVAADKEKAAFTRKVDELGDTISKNEELIVALQKQLDRTHSELRESRSENEEKETERHNSEKALLAMKDMNSQLEASKALLLSERDRLEKLLRERAEAYDKRLEEAAEHERQLMEEQLELERKKYEAQIEELGMQLEKANKKAALEKRAAKERTELYNALSMEVQTQRQQMTQERLSMSQEIEAARNDRTLQDRVEKLEAKLSDAKQKNKQLIGEVARLSGAPSPRQSPRPVSNSNFRSPRSTSKSVASRSMASPMGSPRTPKAVGDPFVIEVGVELERFLGKAVNWTRSRVLSTVNAMIDKITELEEEHERREAKAGSLRFSQASDDWATWADRILAECGRGYRPGCSDREMMHRLEDLVRAGGNPSRLIALVDSLRAQKRLLLAGIPPPEDEEEAEEASILDVIRVCMFIAAAKRSARNAPRPERTVVAKHEPQRDQKTVLSFR